LALAFILALGAGDLAHAKGVTKRKVTLAVDNLGCAHDVEAKPVTLKLAKQEALGLRIQNDCNVGRNTLEGPGYKNLNFALTRNAGLGRGSFQIRLELYNAFNWTNFDLPDNFLGSPTFGQILSAGAPRRMQLGLRYEW